ncbi:MAG: hypothetical protein WD426_00710 [Anditalea sp.]
MPVTVPLGKGNVELKKLSQSDPFKSSNIPKILHVEYDLGGAEHGNKKPTLSSPEILAAIRLDVDYFNQLGSF